MTRTLKLKVGGIYQTSTGRLAIILGEYPPIGLFGNRHCVHGEIESSDGGYYFTEWFVDGTNIGGMRSDNLVAENERLMLKVASTPVQSRQGIGWYIPLGNSTSNQSQPYPCSHEWVETPGFSRIYKDCKHCGKKWEEQ